MADGILQFYPWRAFARDRLIHGEVPLWNPHQFCGTPFAANGQSALFYPPNLIFWLIPTRYAFGVSAIVHFFLAGCFMFWFAGALGMGRWGAAFAGTAFMLNGFAVTWLALPTLPNALTWIPLAGFAAKKHFDSRGGFAWPLLMGLAVAFMLLAGHFQVAYYGLLFLIAYLVFLKVVTWRERGWSVLWRLEVQEKTGLVLGLLAASVQILPSLELVRYNHRLPDISPAAFDWLRQWAFSARHLVLLFVPDFYGNPSAGTYIDWPNNYAELCGYVGVATILLAIGALFARREGPSEFAAAGDPPKAGAAGPQRGGPSSLRSRGPSSGNSAHRWFFAGVATFSLLVATGSPLARWMFFYLPGFGGFSGLARVVCLFDLAVAVLAGFGLGALVGEELACSRGDTPNEETRKREEASSSPTDPKSKTQNPKSEIPPRSTLHALRSPCLLLLPGAAASVAIVMLTMTTMAGRTSGLWAFEMPELLRWAGLLLATVALVCLRDRKLMAGGLIGLVALDLFSFGAGYNLYSRPSDVFPRTELVRLLQEDQQASGGRMLALTTRWTFGQPPVAALPPNTPMVYGLDDIQGYDSLFPRWTKEFMFEANGRRQPSPLINGNMILLGSNVERGAWRVESERNRATGNGQSASRRTTGSTVGAGLRPRPFTGAGLRPRPSWPERPVSALRQAQGGASLSNPAPAVRWDLLSLADVRRLLSPVPPPEEWGFALRARFGELGLYVREAQLVQRPTSNVQRPAFNIQQSASEDGPGRWTLDVGRFPDIRRIGANTFMLSLPEDGRESLVPVTYFPGWRAFRGGEEGLAERAWTMFCRVRFATAREYRRGGSPSPPVQMGGSPSPPVTSGLGEPGEVVLTFLPSSFAVGFFLSLLAVGIGAGLTASRGARLRRGKPRGQVDPPQAD